MVTKTDSTRHKQLDILSGKNCLVTGASSGLGLAVSRQLATRGANVILLCRSRHKGETVIHQIRQEIPGGSVELMLCDFSSMASIQLFIENIRQQHFSLDILFNNAAIMKRQRTLTEDGLEMMFQVNYLAPFILMNELVHMLKKGTRPQIINNGRPSYRLRLDMNDIQFSKNYSMTRSFFLTKLCLLLATLEFASRHEDDRVSSVMVDPGPFKSDLVREIPLVSRIKNLFSAPVTQAAENILYVMNSNITGNNNGKVFRKDQEWPRSDYWNDETIRGHLWELTEVFIRDMLKKGYKAS